MAKNKTFKRQAEATRLLQKIGATRRKSRKAGITVTGELKESLRGRQSPEIANALKFTASTALNEAEKLYSDLLMQLIMLMIKRHKSLCKSIYLNIQNILNH